MTYIVPAGARHPITLADGSTVSAGDEVDELDSKDQYLVDDGVLIEAEKKSTKPKAKQTAEADDKKEDS